MNSTTKQIKWPTKRKSIEIGEVLIVQDGHNRLWLTNSEGESMNLTIDNLKALEELLKQFMFDKF